MFIIPYIIIRKTPDHTWHEFYFELGRALWKRGHCVLECGGVRSDVIDCDSVWFGGEVIVKYAFDDEELCSQYLWVIKKRKCSVV